MPKKVCKFPGCKTSVPRGSVYCDQHREAGASEEYRQDQRHDCREWQHLYNTTRWKRRREAQLKAFPLCADCTRAGRIRLAAVADHITPHRGDEELFYNGELQSLCVPCHSIKTNEEQREK